MYFYLQYCSQDNRRYLDYLYSDVRLGFYAPRGQYVALTKVKLRLEVYVDTYTHAKFHLYRCRGGAQCFL